MSKGYWIAHIDVVELESYKAYVPLSTEAIAAFGGRFIVRAGAAEQVEGELRQRHVIVEFPSYAQALACYHSKSYQAAQKVRAAHALSDVVIVEGAEAANFG